MALNSQTPAAVLAGLAWDEMVDFDCTLGKNSYLVKEAAARNPNISPETQLLLTRDFDEHVRAMSPLLVEMGMPPPDSSMRFIPMAFGSCLLIGTKKKPL